MRKSDFLFRRLVSSGFISRKRRFSHFDRTTSRKISATTVLLFHFARARANVFNDSLRERVFERVAGSKPGEPTEDNFAHGVA